MKRRTFLQTASAAAITASWTGNAFAQAKNNRDITYEPNRPLESQGLRIRDVVKILKKGEKGNVPPVLREEILDKALAGEMTDISPSEKQEEPEKYDVEVLEDVQAFMGTDLNLYGPYSSGEKVELPEKYAKLLVDKGKAKLLEDKTSS